MSKADKFIIEHTMNCSNQIINGNYGTIIPHFNPWLTPDQARKAVEIAREDIYEWLRMNFCNYFDDTRETFDKCIDDLKQAMKDEQGRRRSVGEIPST